MDILKSLENMGVVTCRAYYAGSNDEGFVDRVVAKNAKGIEVRLTDKVRDAVEDYVMELLGSGWELGSGSEGYVTFDVNAGTIKDTYLGEGDPDYED